MKKEAMYGNKIRALRLFRGFSQEYMCQKLEIDTSKYSRIETNSQKPTVDLLEKISKVLGVSTADIISNEPIIIQTNSSTNGTGGIGRIENFYSEQKELIDTLLKSKNDENERLVKQNETLAKQNEMLLKQNEQLMKLLEKKK